jgi:hypothetical protein
MNIHRAAAIAAILLALSSAGPAAAFQARPDSRSAARADSLVRAMAAGDFAAVVARFDDRMRAGRPAPALEQAWREVQAEAGAFRGVRGTRVERQDNLEAVVLAGEFERGAYDISVAFRPDGRVVGLFFTSAYPAPSGAPYTAEQVTVRTPAGFTLVGTLTLPVGARGTVPAVVLISGSGPQDRDSRIPGVPGYRPFQQIADTLSRRGIAVLRLDDRGFGRSGGNAAEANSADLADDARAAVAYLRGRREVAPGRIGLVGHSEGGVIAPMVASADSRIRAVALLAGPSRAGRDVLLYQNRQAVDAMPGLTAVQRDSIMAGVPAQLDALAAANPWYGYYMGYDPLPTARLVRAPVLVLQGATDRQVTADQAPELAAAIRAGGNRDVTLRVFPSVNHLFVRDPEGTADVQRYAALPSKQVAPEVLGALADWLAAKLR